MQIYKILAKPTTYEVTITFLFVSFPFCLSKCNKKQKNTIHKNALLFVSFILFCYFCTHQTIFKVKEPVT